MYKIGICGLGFVGSAIRQSIELKKIDSICYDKYKECDSCIEDLLRCNIIFLCLPTKFNSTTNSYEKNSIHETCKFLAENKFSGGVIIKSTVEPGTTTMLAEKYNMLNFIHNPEFLTARTAAQDYHNQIHIVLGKGIGCENHVYQNVVKYHRENYPEAEISTCSAMESESMKIFANCFYAVKVQFFTELYLLCDKMDLNYDLVKGMIIKNGWLNPMHTDIPGPDGQISYGGLCFPKDTNALLSFMQKNGTPCNVLESVINERDTMRRDNDNCI